MDLSKMKKWSGSSADPPRPPVGEAPVEAPITHALPPEKPREPAYARPVMVEQPGERAGAFGGMWISLVLGLLFVFLGQQFARWAIATASGRPFNTGVEWATGPKAGQVVDYWELQGFTAWNDLSVFSMGVALLVDALIFFLATRSGRVRRSLVWAAIVITGFAVLVNLGLGGYLLSVGVTPIYSLIAVLVGGFMLFDHWATLAQRSRDESMSQ